MDEEAMAGGPQSVPQTGPHDSPGDQRAVPAGGDPRVPWAGRPRWIDILCWAGITLSGIYYWALLPFRAPLVGTHPVLLEVLNGSTEAIVAAAAFARIGHGTLTVVLLAAIPGLMKFDPLYWWAGRLWGERIIALLSGRRNRGARYMGRVRRWGRKFTWPAVVLCPFLPIPNAIIFVIAGWAGMRLVTFLILDLIGSLLWAGMLAGLGYALGHHAVVVAQTISHYGLWVSIAIIVLIMASQIRSQRRMLRAARQASAVQQASGSGQASGTQQTGVTGHASQAGQASGSGQASGTGHASQAGQASGAGHSSGAGEASGTRQVGGTGRSSGTGQASGAQQASVAMQTSGIEEAGS